MAHIEDGKGSKSANVEINIVPVIDLMSVLIVFLLITAVWNQISMIQLATSVYGKKTDDQPVEKPKKMEIPLRLDIKKNGYVLVLKDRPIRIPLVKGEYDTKTLGLKLRKIKEMYPKKTDIIIAVEDTINYGSLIKGMDVAIVEKFPQLSIATGDTQ